jgi:hypothetical protein
MRNNPLGIQLRKIRFVNAGSPEFAEKIRKLSILEISAATIPMENNDCVTGYQSASRQEQSITRARLPV